MSYYSMRKPKCMASVIAAIMDRECVIYRCHESTYIFMCKHLGNLMLQPSPKLPSVTQLFTKFKCDDIKIRCNVANNADQAEVCLYASNGVDTDQWLAIVNLEVGLALVRDMHHYSNEHFWEQCEPVIGPY